MDKEPVGFDALLWGDGNLLWATMVGPFLASALEGFGIPLSLSLQHDAPWLILVQIKRQTYMDLLQLLPPN